MEQFAELYVNYIEPGFKWFLMFMLVMAVLAFWAQVKEGKFLELANTVFHGTLNYTYKAVVAVGMAIWIVLRTIGRVVNIIFATIRDFFISRI